MARKKKNAKKRKACVEPKCGRRAQSSHTNEGGEHSGRLEEPGPACEDEIQMDVSNQKEPIWKAAKRKKDRSGERAKDKERRQNRRETDKRQRQEERRRDATTKRDQRNEHGFRQAERIRDKESRRELRDDQDIREQEKARDRESKRTLRENPEYRNRERVRDMASQAQLRADPAKSPLLKFASWEKLLEMYTSEIKDGPTHPCASCGGLWFAKSMREITAKFLLKKGCSEERMTSILQVNNSAGKHELCGTCYHSAIMNELPRRNLTNGFAYPDLPPLLRNLTSLEERLVAPRLPFMQIREVGVYRQKGLRGNVVNVPKNLDICAKTLPREFGQTSTVESSHVIEYEKRAPREQVVVGKSRRAVKLVKSSEN